MTILTDCPNSPTVTSVDAAVVNDHRVAKCRLQKMTQIVLIPSRSYNNCISSEVSSVFTWSQLNKELDAARLKCTNMVAKCFVLDAFYISYSYISANLLDCSFIEISSNGLPLKVDWGHFTFRVVSAQLQQQKYCALAQDPPNKWKKRLFKNIHKNCKKKKPQKNKQTKQKPSIIIQCCQEVRELPLR